MSSLGFNNVLDKVKETIGAVLESATVGSSGRFKSHGYIGTVVDGKFTEASVTALVVD